MKNIIESRKKRVLEALGYEWELPTPIFHRAGLNYYDVLATLDLLLEDGKVEMQQLGRSKFWRRKK